MSKSTQEQAVRFRPYARLLTMLGEQLIKNDRIALVELIKNSFDADAERVVVDYSNIVSRQGSSITILDNGDGMSEQTIVRDWLNPATPNKRDIKRRRPATRGGRIVQGEKGIGRFAMFKLGSRIEMVTRPEGSTVEYVVEVDLTFLDSEESAVQTAAGPESTPVFIDDIPVNLTTRQPVVFAVGGNPLDSIKGTRLRISSLRSDWNTRLIAECFDDVSRLQPLVPRAIDTDGPVRTGMYSSEPQGFRVTFSLDGLDLGLQSSHDAELRRLFEERAVLRVSGQFDQTERSLLLNVNDSISLVSVDDHAFRSLKAFRDAFPLEISQGTNPNLSCGSFDFSFFIFDLTRKAPEIHRLDADERDRVKAHRIYLYRDGIRVLPYGDNTDDWLQLDTARGVQAAGRTLSNDQIVGFIYISHSANEALRDKTNREGLLDSGDAVKQFIGLVQATLSYLKKYHYDKYVADQERRAQARRRSSDEIVADIEAMIARTDLPLQVTQRLKSLRKNYAAEREFTAKRLERTEDLAGVGLSVEAASHDILATATVALNQTRAARRHSASFHPEDEQLRHYLVSVDESVSFVATRLDDVQGLFVSTRRGHEDLDPLAAAEKVRRMYSGLLRESDIHLSIERSSGPISVHTSEAALLQAFVNIIDNAIYWLRASRTPSPTINIFTDGNHRVIVSDNGPGVSPSDAPYIFEPFFSGKGEDGKGLGLYIAQQVGLRHGFTVSLIEEPGPRRLKGANFLLFFGKQR